MELGALILGWGVLELGLNVVGCVVVEGNAGMDDVCEGALVGILGRTSES